jgi:hypothetical protein
MLFQTQIMMADQTSLNANNKTQKFQVDVYMSVLFINQAEIVSQQLAYKHLPSPCLFLSAIILFVCVCVCVCVHTHTKKCRTDP